MDTIRRGFVTEMYLWGPDEPPVPVRWHRCHPDAKTFTEGHIWHSITWQQQGGHNERIDLLGPRGAYDKGKDHVGYRGAEFHGPLRLFQEPAVLGEDVQMVTGVDGSIAECRRFSSQYRLWPIVGNASLRVPVGAIPGDRLLLVGGSKDEIGSWDTIDGWDLVAYGDNPGLTIKWGIWTRIRQDGDSNVIPYGQSFSSGTAFFSFWIRGEGTVDVGSVAYGNGLTVSIPELTAPTSEESLALNFAFHDGFSTVMNGPDTFTRLPFGLSPPTELFHAFSLIPSFGTIPANQATTDVGGEWFGLPVRVRMT